MINNIEICKELKKKIEETNNEKDRLSNLEKRTVILREINKNIRANKNDSNEVLRFSKLVSLFNPL